MGRRGIHPKPIEAKILAGTFREDRDGSIDEAVLAKGVPIKPEHLTGEAGKFWDENMPRLATHGLGVSDTNAFATMCEWWGRYRCAMDALTKLKSMATAKSRALMIQASDAFRRFDSIACRFGMTPADRTRLRVEPTKKQGVASRQRA